MLEEFETVAFGIFVLGTLEGQLAPLRRDLFLPINRPPVSARGLGRDQPLVICESGKNQ